MGRDVVEAAPPRRTGVCGVRAGPPFTKALQSLSLSSFLYSVNRVLLILSSKLMTRLINCCLLYFFPPTVMQSLLQSLAFDMLIASVFVDSSNILLLFYWYCVFEAGTEFGQIGPAVSKK